MIHARRMCALLLAVLLAGCEVGTETTPSGVATANGKPPASVPAAAHAPADQRIARGNLHFVDGYRQGYKKALDEGKPMLVFFTAQWCHFCHQMAEEAFRNPQVVGLSERFVCILVDADAEPDVCKQFRVQGYPTIVFMSPRGVPLNRIKGKQPGPQIMIAMQAALQNVARHDDANRETDVR